MNITTLNTIGMDGVIIKKGGTTPTPPSGGESGGSDWHYFDVSGLEVLKKPQVIQIGMMYKVQGESIKNILGVADTVMPIGFGNVVLVEVDEIKAIGTDYSTEVRIGEQSMTIEQVIITAPWYGQVPEITKEEFYNLD